MNACALKEPADLARHGCWLLSPADDLKLRIDGLVAHAYSFFKDINVEERLRHCTTVGEGYRAFATEYTDSPDQPDLVEVFSCSVPRAVARAGFPSGPGLALYDALLGAHPLYAELADQLARRLLASVGMELAPDFSFDFLNWSRLQLNFGVLRRARRTLLNVRHEDQNFITIGFATAPGLEVVTDDHPVDLWGVRGPELVVLAGSILSIATHGAICTGFHQVRRRRDVNERISIIYFADASPAALVRIDPSRSQEGFFRLISEGWLSSGVAPVQASLPPADGQR